MPTTTNIRFDAVTDTIANIATDDYQGRMGYASDAPGGSGTWRINYDGVNIAYLARRNAANTWDAGTQTFTDSVFRLADGGDTTKLLAFELSGLTTATTRTITIPDASGTLALTSSAAFWNVISQTATPPGSPAVGDTYIVSNGATGAWAGQDQTIARYTSGGWEFYTTTGGMGAGASGNYKIYTKRAAGWESTVESDYLYGATSVTIAGAYSFSSSGDSALLFSGGGGAAADMKFVDTGRLRWHTDLYLSRSTTSTLRISSNGSTGAADLDVRGNLLIAGTTRISSAGAGTLASLTTDTITAATSAGVLIEGNSGTDVALFGAGGGAGATFYGQINGTALQLSGLTSGRLPTIGSSGLIGNDAGWTYTQTSSVTTTVTVGDGAAAAAAGFLVNAAAGQVAALALRSAGATRWSVARLATSLDFAIISRDSGGAEIDTPVSIVNASAGLITIGGSSSRTTNFTGAVQVGGTTVVSAARAGTFTSLAITGATQFQIPYIQSGGSTITTNASFTFNGTKLGVPAATTSNASINIPTGTAPSSPVAGDVWHDSTTKSTAIYSNAITGYVSRCIYSQYAATTQTGAVTNQTLSNASARGTRTLPANFLNVQGKRLRYYLCGVYTTDASAGNAEIRIRIGSTTFRTTGTFGLDNSITNGWWRLTGELSCYTTGATGTLAGTMAWEHQASSVVGSEVMHLQVATTTGAVTLDLTASNAFDVDWTASDAGTSITCTCFALYEEA